MKARTAETILITMFTTTGLYIAYKCLVWTAEWFDKVSEIMNKL